MTSAEFWNSTPKEFHYRQKGYFQKIERLDRANWERTRWQTLRLLEIHVPKGKNLKLTDLAVFPWEQKALEVKNKIDPIALKRMADAMDAHAKNINENSKVVPITELLNQ